MPHKEGDTLNFRTRSSATMNFPPEILSSVLSHQPKTELKTVRLVCKAFDAAAVPFLFKEIYLIARYADIEKASLLAGRFGSYVKTLILSSEVFDAYVSWEMFQCTIPNEDLAKSYYDSYRKLEEEQEELLSEGEFFGHLCNTLTVLPHLQKVILTNGECTERLCWCQQAYVDGHSRKYNPFLDTDNPELKSLRPPPEHTCLTTINGLDQTSWNVWPQLLCALYTTGNTRVKAIATELCRSGLTVNAFGMTTPRQRYCTAKILPNLTSLHLHLDFHYFDGLHEILSDRVIARTLSAAINLESLVIESKDHTIKREEEYQHTPTTFEMILEGCDMPKLITFGWGNSAFREAEMTNFLQHSQRIKHMSFHDLTLISGSWENMFHTIKGGLALESFKVKCLYGGVAELSKAGFDCALYEPYAAIEKFLSGGGPNPFSIAALEHAATENQYLRKQQKQIEKK